MGLLAPSALRPLTVSHRDPYLVTNRILPCALPQSRGELTRGSRSNFPFLRLFGSHGTSLSFAFPCSWSHARVSILNLLVFYTSSLQPPLVTGRHRQSTAFSSHCHESIRRGLNNLNYPSHSLATTSLGFPLSAYMSMFDLCLGSTPLR